MTAIALMICRFVSTGLSYHAGTDEFADQAEVDFAALEKAYAGES
jgi:hypothetical protein